MCWSAEGGLICAGSGGQAAAGGSTDERVAHGIYGDCLSQWRIEVGSPGERSVGIQFQTKLTALPPVEWKLERYAPRVTGKSFELVEPVT